MVRYKPSDFLSEYERYLQTVNTAKKGAVELVMKRYDAAEEAKLNPSCNKTGSDQTVCAKPAATTTTTKTPESTKNTKNNNNKKQSKQPTKLHTINNPDDASDAALQEPSLLVRAKFGDKKASCVVKAAEFAAFNEHFRTLFRLYNSKYLVPDGGISLNMKGRKAVTKKGFKPNPFKRPEVPKPAAVTTPVESPKPVETTKQNNNNQQQQQQKQPQQSKPQQQKKGKK